MSLTLLVADDARDVAEVVGFAARFTWPECRVVIARSGAEALRLFAATQPDLVVLDVEMPPPDGIEVCRQIRESSTVPILMLTVRDATVDKVRALDLGADDYLTKPFEHLELLARLKALVRRAALPVTAGRATDDPLVVGELTLDRTNREVHVQNQPVRLTSTEFRLLEELARQAGVVVPHRQLLDRVWGPAYTADTAFLKVFVRRLRRKLGDDAERPQYIQTEWGVGYRLLPPR